MFYYNVASGNSINSINCEFAKMFYDFDHDFAFYAFLFDITKQIFVEVHFYMSCMFDCH